LERDDFGLFVDITRFTYANMLKETAKDIDQAVSKLTEF